MKRLLLVILAFGVSASVAMAQETHCYGWEDADATTVGANYLPALLTISNNTAQAFEGSRSLEVWKSSATSGTPQAYVAWVTNLAVGDVITATVQTYDTVSGNPSLRIWGHWTPVGGDVNSYLSSASGNSTYSGATPGWNELSYSWTAIAGAAGLVIEIRGYNGTTPVLTPCYVDRLCITHPASAYVTFPGPNPVAAEQSTWSSVKALYN